MFNLLDIIKSHHDSLIEDSQSRRRVLSKIYAPAVISIGIVTVVALRYPDKITLNATSSASLIAAFALLTAILFGLSLTILDKAIDSDLAGQAPGESTDRSARRLQALSANTLYTSIVAAFATGILVFGEVLPAFESAATTIGVAAMILVGTNGALILGRVYRETKWRTDRVRTGESRRMSTFQSSSR